MKAIDRAKLHFSKQEVRIIEVPQWGDDDGTPLKIYVKPLTVRDRDHLAKIEKRIGQGLETIVQGMILHCRDENGAPLFTLADKPDLMNRVDPEIILSIGTQAFREYDEDAIKKNSETI